MHPFNLWSLSWTNKWMWATCPAVSRILSISEVPSVSWNLRMSRVISIRNDSSSPWFHSPNTSTNIQTLTRIKHWQNTRLSTLGPHHCRARQFPLAERARACTLQAGDDCLSLAERHGSIIPGCRPATFVNMPSGRRLWSSLTHQLDVPKSQCATVNDHAFIVAGARLRNSLPPDIIASNALSQFCHQLKTFLFR